MVIFGSYTVTKSKKARNVYTTVRKEPKLNAVGAARVQKNAGYPDHQRDRLLKVVVVIRQLCLLGSLYFRLVFLCKGGVHLDLRRSQGGHGHKLQVGVAH